MKYTIESLDERQMVYMRISGAYGSIAHFDKMSEFKRWISENGLEEIQVTEGIIGIAQDNPSIVAPEDCRYDLLLFTNQDFSHDNRVVMGKFQGGSYVVFRVSHTSEAIQVFWKTFQQKIIMHNWPIANKPIIERYKEEVGSDNYCEFLIPLKYSLR